MQWLQAELNRLDNRSMAPSLFDIKVFAVGPSDGKLTIVRNIARVDAVRAAGCSIAIDLRLATNFPLTMKDREALQGDLCHGVYRIEGHALYTAIVHNMHTRSDNPWRVIDDMRMHIEQTLA